MKLASLTSTLLARKGTAGPSRLRKAETETLDLRPLAPPAKSLTDISLAGGRAGAVENPEPETNRARPTRAIAMRRPAAAKPKKDNTGRIKMSLRLEPARHARLRVTAARTERRMQDIMSVALDRYLDDLDITAPAKKPAGRSPARKSK